MEEKKNISKMTSSEILEEKRRCEFGFDGMSGEEYFFFNYCWIDGKPQEYSPEALLLYRQHVESMRYMDSIKNRRSGPSMIREQYEKMISEHPLVPDDYFKLSNDKKEEYPGLTLSKLEKILDEVLANRPKQNSFYITGVCRSRGLVTIDLINSGLCSDIDCGLCGPFNKTMKDMAPAECECSSCTTTTSESCKNRETKTHKTHCSKHNYKEEVKDFSEKNDPYEREQERNRQKFYRRKR